MSTPFAINGTSLNGLILPEPAKATFSVQDIDSSETGRNQAGTMMRDRVDVKIKWQLTFPPLNRTMVANLLNAISAASFEFTYPDPFSATGTATKTCYVGDRTAPAYSTADDESEDGIPVWENVSFSVIEM